MNVYHTFTPAPIQEKKVPISLRIFGGVKQFFIEFLYLTKGGSVS